MGKKLSSWEVASRRRERERERENAASVRRSEREAAARTRLREKERAAALRAEERQTIRDEKERARRQEVERREYEQRERENLVAECERYLRDLQRLHALAPVGSASAGHILQPITIVSRSQWLDTYRSRAVARSRVPNQFQPEVLPALEYKEVTPSPCSFFKSKAFAWASLASMTTAMLLVWWVARFRAPTGGNWTTTLTIAAMIWLLVTSSTIVAAIVLRRRYLVRWQGKLEEAQRAAQKYIADNEAAIQADFQTRQARRMALFQQTEEQLDSQWNDNEEQRLELLSDVQEGSAAAVALLVEAILPLDFQVRSPEELGTSDLRDHEVGYHVIDGATLGLRILLPSSDVVPSYRLELTATGQKVKQLAIARDERTRLYLSMASSLSLAYILRCVQAIPFLRRVAVEATTTGVSGSTGHEVQQPIVSVDVAVDRLENLVVSKVDPIEALTRLGAQFGTQTGLTESEQVTWASRDDTILGLPTGLTDLGLFPANSNPHTALPEDHHLYLVHCAERRTKVTNEIREQVPIPAAPSPLQGLYLFLLAIAAPPVAAWWTMLDSALPAATAPHDGGLPSGDAQSSVESHASPDTPTVAAMIPGHRWFCAANRFFTPSSSSCYRTQQDCEEYRRTMISSNRQQGLSGSLIGRCLPRPSAVCFTRIMRSTGAMIASCHGNADQCQDHRRRNLTGSEFTVMSACSSLE